jgi:hypothetical protein
MNIAQPILRGLRTSALRAAAVAWAASIFGLPADAQFPDALSDIECPGCRAHLEARVQPAEAAQADTQGKPGPEARPPQLAGTWSSALTSSDDPAWALEDFFCVVACTRETRASATALLEDPANAHRPMAELLARAATAPKFACDPHGFASQVVSPLPLEIRQQPGRVVLRYEEFAAERTILLDGHVSHSAHHAWPLGVSKGRFEDGAFVVETTHTPSGRLYDGLGDGVHSDKLRAIERYTTSPDGNWLFLVLRLEDPEALREPLILLKSWRRTPNAEILSHHCDVMSGQLEGVAAEYFDPAKLDERRK